jgi:class 3 adenylate cyclase
MTHGAGSDPTEKPPIEVAPAGTPGAEPPVPLTFAPTVTLFFSDIRGFTEYTDAHGDAAAFRMLQFHNTMVQEQIALYGGHIVKTLGDSYMVSFNAARNAMACGIGIQKTLALYNEKEIGAKIHIGIGINMGEPILDADDFFGGSVNLAARICAVAGAGQILVPEGVRHVVGKMEGTDYIDRGQFELKGFHELQHLYEVDWSGLGTSVATPPAAVPSVIRPQPAPLTAGTVDGPPEQAAARPSKPASRRMPIIVGVVVLLLALGGGAFLLLRGRGNERSANVATNTAPGPQTAASPVTKPAQATASPGASGAAPAGASPQASKPSSVAQPSPKPATSETGRPLRSDDFSDPARGLFTNNVQGIGRITGDGSAPLDFQGNYAYQNGAMVAKLIGDHPGGDRAVFSRMLLANDRLTEDFAVEVRARITSSPNATRFGLQYALSQADFFTFTIFPGTTGYNISRTANQQAQLLAAGRSSAMRPPREDNLLRIQVRGNTVRLFINGQEVGLATHESLGKRDGQVALNIAANGPLDNRTAEVEFRDFKVFALSP